MGNKSTRGWDDVNQVTLLQREKEEAHDYRYFPDPDLVPVELSDEWRADIKSRLCELPLQKKMRFVSEYGLSDYDAGVLTADRSTAEFFDEAVKAGGEPKRLCNLITQDYTRIANEQECTVGELGVSPENVAKLAQMVVQGDVSSTAASNIVTLSSSSWNEDPWDIAQKHNLVQKSDTGELEAVVDAVLAENAEAVQQIKQGGKKSGKARGFLLGQVMQKTKGQANPKVVSEILGKKIP